MVQSPASCTLSGLVAEEEGEEEDTFGLFSLVLGLEDMGICYRLPETPN